MPALLDLEASAFLVMYGIVRAFEDVVGGDLIEICKCNQVSDRKLICTAFIAGVHRLRSVQNIGNFLLCQIMILSKIT